MRSLVGLVGDSLTFIGSALLALDAILKERGFNRSKSLLETITNPALAKVTLERNGIVLKNEDDVELLLIRSSVRRGIWGGNCILTIGFLCLSIARFDEPRTPDASTASTPSYSSGPTPKSH